MNKRLLQVALFLLVSNSLLSQGEIDDQENIFWRNERSVGGVLYSDGWGFMFRDLRQGKPSNRTFIEAGLGFIKHPKEIKITTYPYLSSGAFVYGKLNSTLTVKGGLGYEYEIFQKRDLGGVSISWHGNGGLALTFAKPIYYEVIVKISNDTYGLEEIKFNSDSIHQALDIFDKASFFRGFNEIKLYPGLYAGTGFIFEFSRNEKITHSIEFGTSFSAYLSKIPIMYSEKNQPDNINKQFFPSLYVSYRIGMILDPLKPGKFFPNLIKRKAEE